MGLQLCIRTELGFSNPRPCLLNMPLRHWERRFFFLRRVPKLITSKKNNPCIPCDVAMLLVFCPDCQKMKQFEGPQSSNGQSSSYPRAWLFVIADWCQFSLKMLEENTSRPFLALTVWHHRQNNLALGCIARTIQISGTYAISVLAEPFSDNTPSNEWRARKVSQPVSQIAAASNYNYSCYPLVKKNTGAGFCDTCSPCLKRMIWLRIFSKLILSLACDKATKLQLGPGVIRFILIFTPLSSVPTA